MPTDLARTRARRGIVNTLRAIPWPEHMMPEYGWAMGEGMLVRTDKRKSNGPPPHPHRPREWWEIVRHGRVTCMSRLRTFAQMVGVTNVERGERLYRARRTTPGSSHHSVTRKLAFGLVEGS